MLSDFHVSLKQKENGIRLLPSVALRPAKTAHEWSRPYFDNIKFKRKRDDIVEIADGHNAPKLDISGRSLLLLIFSLPCSISKQNL